MADLLHPDEALYQILAALPPPVVVSVDLAEACGRVILAGLPNLVDQPPFDRATMDGFALPGQAPEGSTFRIQATIAAGSPFLAPLEPGACARIMTGAPLPPGATSVQRVEWTSVEGDIMTVTRAEGTSNVNHRGDNLRVGDPLLPPGRLRPAHLGVLASSGYGRVEVARRPVVGILSTGDELRPAGQALVAAAIYDSNGPTLAALAAEAGAEVRSYGIVRDDPAALRAALERGLRDCDVLLTSGGVSMGDFDYLPGLLGDLGVEALFHKVAMKPGKPLWFGRRVAGDRTVLVFGLPGNPVSSFAGFQVFVLPALRALQGLDPAPSLVRVRLASEVVHTDPGRLEFLPVRLSGPAPGDECPRAALVRYTGSTMVQALAWADALLRIEVGIDRLEEGSLVDVRSLRP